VTGGILVDTHILLWARTGPEILHHGNPFDRMLIAQAKSEQLSLLTRDRAMLGYANQATILRLPEA
jgi:PIN domain nuclease of toxin-antitoxin system